MATKLLPTPEQLRQLLRYEPDTGKIFWRERTPDLFRDGARKSARTACKQWNTRHAGKEALACIDANGYRHGTALSISMAAHRVIWAIHYGEWPQDEIDHKDGDRSNNRIGNLRAATSALNKMNRALRRDNKTGTPGITWHHREKRWRARIGSHKSLGYFLTKDEAVAARRKAERELGYSARHGY